MGYRILKKKLNSWCLCGWDRYAKVSSFFLFYILKRCFFKSCVSLREVIKIVWGTKRKRLAGLVTSYQLRTLGNCKLSLSQLTHIPKQGMITSRFMFEPFSHCHSPREWFKNTTTHTSWCRSSVKRSRKVKLHNDYYSLFYLFLSYKNRLALCGFLNVKNGSEQDNEA